MYRLTSRRIPERVWYSFRLPTLTNQGGMLGSSYSFFSCLGRSLLFWENKNREFSELAIAWISDIEGRKPDDVVLVAASLLSEPAKTEF